MFRGRTVPTIAAMSIFVGLCLVYRNYALDDAFIVYRFADNFARGWGWVWNPGEPPVRGFTSFSWALLLAGSSALGFGPVAAAKIFAALAALGIVALVVRAGRRLAPSALALVLAGIAANGAFAFVVSEGLETGLTALVVAALSLMALKLSSGPAGGRDLLILFGLCLLAYWTRPDAAVFNAGLAGGLLALKAARRDWASLKTLTASGAITGAALAALTYWHYRYFNDIFPTSYYLKVAAQRGVNFRSFLFLISFIAPALLPVWVAGFALRREFDRRRAVETMPALVAVGAFFVYSLFIDPIQGFCWRFLFPMYPALVLALVHVVSGPDRLAEPRRPILANACAYALSLALIVFAWPELKNNDSDDLRRVGRALAGLHGRMFVTESGAAPYYSGWQSHDLVGLTWPPTARDGLSRQQLEEFDPDLVLVHESAGVYRPYIRRKILLNDYMIERGFVAVAAIRKCPGEYHFYFARRDSPLLTELIARLHSIPGVEYGDLKELMGEPRLPLLIPQAGEAGNRRER